MSTSTNLLFITCLVVALLTAPVLADNSQEAVGVINGDNNDQVVGNKIVTNVGKQYIDEDVSAPSYININYEAQVDTSVQVDGLDVGTVDESVLVFKDEVISYPVLENQTYYIRSGAPIAVYTIATGNDRMLLSSSESVLTYDPIYHKFNHGIVSPLRIFPKY